MGLLDVGLQGQAAGDFGPREFGHQILGVGWLAVAAAVVGGAAAEVVAAVVLVLALALALALAWTAAATVAVAAVVMRVAVVAVVVLAAAVVVLAAVVAAAPPHVKCRAQMNIAKAEAKVRHFRHVILPPFPMRNLHRPS